MGLKFQGVHIREPFFYIVQKPHTPNSKKAHYHANEQQRAKALFEQSHEQQAQRAAHAVTIHISPSSIIALLLVCFMLAECAKH